MSETPIKVDVPLSRRFTKSDDNGSSLRRVREQSRRNSAFAHRDEVPASDAGVDLFWSGDLLLLVLHQL